MFGVAFGAWCIVVLIDHGPQFGVAGMAQAAERVSVFESASAAQLSASQQGKPFVLVVWSLDCVYCKRNFEAIGKLQAKHRGLRVVTLAMDRPDALPQVQQLLKRVNLTRNAWMFGNEPQDRLRYAVDPDWMGEMPRTYCGPMLRKTPW